MMLVRIRLARFVVPSGTLSGILRGKDKAVHNEHSATGAKVFALPVAPSEDQIATSIRALAELVVALRVEVVELRAVVAALKPRQRDRSAQRLLSQREAAKRLGIDRGSTLGDLVASKKIRTVEVNGRLRIPASEVERLASQGFDTQVSPRRDH